MTITSMAVFCGSKTGNNSLFELHAKQLGYFLAEKNIKLVYGGGNKGLMGTVANAVLEKNGYVIGIIPQLLTDREHSHNGINELIVVENMHTRKKMLYEKCDAAVILPGGFGTLDEFFEMLTWNQLSIHNKKIFVLNSGGFYNNLLMHAKQMQAENFLYDAVEERLVVIDVPEKLEMFL
jgi:uncharacterized protein (TIGR00730 family)